MNIDSSFSASRSRYSDSDLMRALETAAAMIELFGEPAIPFFEKLETEYHRRMTMKSAMSRAVALIEEGRIKLLT